MQKCHETRSVFVNEKCPTVGSVDDLMWSPISRFSFTALNETQSTEADAFVMRSGPVELWERESSWCFSCIYDDRKWVQDRSLIWTQIKAETDAKEQKKHGD